MPAEIEQGKVIIINGPSSSGKTSVAELLQGLLPELYLQLSIDSLYQIAFPAAFIQSELRLKQISERQPAFRAGFSDSVAALARAGNNLILDHVLLPFDLFYCLLYFQGLSVYFVGLKCNVAELKKREAARPDRLPGSALEQSTLVHQHGCYDLELDTGKLLPEDCALMIKEKQMLDPAGKAFSRLRNKLSKQKTAAAISGFKADHFKQPWSWFIS